MSTDTPLTRARAQALAHSCHACHKPWALRVVEHPSGRVVICRYCSAVKAKTRRRPVDLAGTA